MVVAYSINSILNVIFRRDMKRIDFDYFGLSSRSGGDGQAVCTAATYCDVVGLVCGGV